MKPMEIVTCPWCNGNIEIIKLNCAIFRHAVFKKNNKQVNPHLSELECKKLLEQNLVNGCSMPFEIINGKAIKCDYK